MEKEKETLDENITEETNNEVDLSEHKRKRKRSFSKRKIRKTKRISRLKN